MEHFYKRKAVSGVQGNPSDVAFVGTCTSMYAPTCQDEGHILNLEATLFASFDFLICLCPSEARYGWPRQGKSLNFLFRGGISNESNDRGERQFGMG